MKKTVLLALFTIGIALMSGTAIYAQNTDAEFEKDLALLRKDLRSDKKQLLALNMTLTDSEATKFWPIYDKYTAEQTKLYDQRIALIKEYAMNYEKLTNLQAASLSQRSIAVDQALVALRLRYVPLVGKVLPGKKSALFFQVDKRIGLLIDLQLASGIPLVTQ